MPQPCLHHCTCHQSPYDRANILDCKEKGFISLPDTVLKDTGWLLISGNNLGSLNKAPDYLKNITLLDLSSSQITEINEIVMEFINTNVKHLDVRGNNLKTLPQTITKANSMTKLWISDNPYQCECDFLWMKDWLVRTKNVVDKENVTCSGSNKKDKMNH